MPGAMACGVAIAVEYDREDIIFSRKGLERLGILARPVCSGSREVRCGADLVPDDALLKVQVAATCAVRRCRALLKQESHTYEDCCRGPLSAREAILRSNAEVVQVHAPKVICDEML
jgi:hypothetical protein